MAITAKDDVFALATASSQDVQPASGEVWLVTSISVPTVGTDPFNQHIGLYDGTDDSRGFFSSINSATRSSPGVRKDAAGENNWSYSGHLSTKIVLTNTVRLRFRNDTGNTLSYGYTGVQL